MDIFSHGLYGGIATGRKSKKIIGLHYFLVWAQISYLLALFSYLIFLDLNLGLEKILFHLIQSPSQILFILFIVLPTAWLSTLCFLRYFGFWVKRVLLNLLLAGFFISQLISQLTRRNFSPPLSCGRFQIFMLTGYLGAIR